MSIYGGDILIKAYRWKSMLLTCILNRSDDMKESKKKKKIETELGWHRNDENPKELWISWGRILGEHCNDWNPKETRNRLRHNCHDRNHLKIGDMQKGP